MTKSFPTGSLRIDPKAAAVEMIRLFGEGAEVLRPSPSLYSAFDRF